MELHKERKKAKFLKELECGSTRLACTVTWLVCRHSIILKPVRERDSIIIHLLAYRTAYFFSFSLLNSPLPFYFTLFLLTLLYSLLPFCLDEINLNSFSSFFRQKYSEFYFLSDWEKFSVSAYEFYTLAARV